MSKQKPDVSLGPDDAKIVARLNKTQKLLRYFEVEACAFDPGVVGFIKGKEGEINRRLNFEQYEWEFIEPLLIELIQWRKYGEKFSMFMSTKERRKYETVRKK